MDVTFLKIEVASNFIVRKKRIGIKEIERIKNLLLPAKPPTIINSKKISIQRIFEYSTELLLHSEKERNAQINIVKPKKFISPTNALPFG